MNAKFTILITMLLLEFSANSQTRSPNESTRLGPLNVDGNLSKQEKAMQAALYQRIDSRILTLLRDESYLLDLHLLFETKIDKTKSGDDKSGQSIGLPGLGYSIDSKHNISDESSSFIDSSKKIKEVNIKLMLGSNAVAKFKGTLEESIRSTLKLDAPQAQISIRIVSDKKLNRPELAISQQKDQTVIIADRKWEQSFVDTLTKWNKNLDLFFASFTEGALVSKIRNDFIIILFLIAMIPTFISIWLIRTVKAMSKQLAFAGEKIASEIASGSSSAAGKDSGQMLSERVKSSSPNSSKNHESSLAQLKTLVQDNIEVTISLLELLSKTNHFQELMILLGAVSNEIRAAFLNQPSHENSDNFRLFIRSSGNDILGNEDLLNPIISKLRDMIWLGSQDPESVPVVILKQTLNDLDNQVIENVFAKACLEDQRILLDLVPQNKIAFLMANEKLDGSSVLKAAKSPLQPINAFRLLQVIKSQSSQETSTPATFEWRHLLNYLPDESTLKLNLGAEADPISSEERIRQDFDSVRKWIATKSIVEAAEFFACISESLQNEIVAGMPDIKVRRIRSTSRPLTENGLQLKADLLKYIEENGQQKEVQLDAA
jgi:hypothetical protein